MYQTKGPGLHSGVYKHLKAHFIRFCMKALRQMSGWELSGAGVACLMAISVLHLIQGISCRLCRLGAQPVLDICQLSLTLTEREDKPAQS